MRYKFEEIAGNSKEKRMPTPEDKEKYVGLEHLDTKDLEVHRFGSDVDITGQKLVMHKGDLLFGRRNTYLRRAAIAPHDGLFSAHGMILIPNKDVVDPDFFPFFISSDYFMDAAIRISVGSLSPTVNWSQLKELEFDLPSIEEQRKLAKILWAFERARRVYRRTLVLLDDLVKSQFVEMFGDPISNPNGWLKLTVREAVDKGLIARPLDGNHGEKHPKNSDYVPQGVPFLMAQDLKDKRVDFTQCHFITEKQAKTLTKGWAKTGDVLLTNKGTIGRVAIIQPSEYEDMLLTPQITYYRCLKEIDNRYLAAFFGTEFFINQLSQLTTGTTRASVTITQQEKLELIIPPREMQMRFVSLVEQIDKSKLAINQSLIRLEKGKKAVMTKAFG